MFGFKINMNIDEAKYKLRCASEKRDGILYFFGDKAFIKYWNFLAFVRLTKIDDNYSKVSLILVPRLSIILSLVCLFNTEVLLKFVLIIFIFVLIWSVKNSIVYSNNKLKDILRW